MSEQKSSGQTIVGKVIQNSMDKTVVIQVERKVKHPLYGKYMRRFSKMYAHDDENTCMVGDTVIIKQSRPLSKTKHWILVKVIERAEKEISE